MSIHLGPTRRSADWLYTFLAKQRLKHLTELCIAVCDQVLLALEESIFTVGSFASCLFHPGFVWTRSATGKVDSTSLHLHHEQQVEVTSPHEQYQLLS